MYDIKEIDTIGKRYLEKVRKADREKQVMLDLWYMATKGKPVMMSFVNIFKYDRKNH